MYCVRRLKLQERTENCDVHSRWAVFGLKRGKVAHCVRHKKPDEFDVLHVYKRSGISKSLGSAMDDEGGTQTDIPVNSVAQEAMSDLLSFRQRRSNSCWTAHSTKSRSLFHLRHTWFAWLIQQNPTAVGRLIQQNHSLKIPLFLFL